jgi:transposase
LITIGVDAHKSMNAAFALDGAGKELESWEGPNTEAGWHSLLKWAVNLGPDRHWGIEGAWGYGRGLSQHLVAAGETVYEINARWTALRRRSAHKPGKTDELDAHAIALFVRQEGTELPRVLLEDETTMLELLTGQREIAQAEATRLRNQIHALLLDPEYKAHLPTINSKAGIQALQGYTALTESPLRQQCALVVRRLASRLALTLAHEAELAREIRELAKVKFEPLTKLCGINLLTAGRLAAILVQATASSPTLSLPHTLAWRLWKPHLQGK